MFLSEEQLLKLRACDEAITAVLNDGDLQAKCRELGLVVLKNPAVSFVKQAEAGAYDAISDAAYELELQCVEEKAKLWDESPRICENYRTNYLLMLQNAAATLELIVKLQNFDRIVAECNAIDEEYAVKKAALIGNESRSDYDVMDDDEMMMPDMSDMPDDM